MRYVDQACAWMILLAGVAHILITELAHIPGAVLDPGVMWIFLAMLNLLRIRNGKRRYPHHRDCALENVRAAGRRPSYCRFLRNNIFYQAETVILIQENSAGVTFVVKIHPRAQKNAITGQLGDVLKLSLTAPPVEGRANEACIEFLANLLKVPPSSVTIASGQTNRKKVIRVAGLSAEGVRKRLGI